MSIRTGRQEHAEHVQGESEGAGWDGGRDGKEEGREGRGWEGHAYLMEKLEKCLLNKLNCNFRRFLWSR